MEKSIGLSNGGYYTLGGCFGVTSKMLILS